METFLNKNFKYCPKCKAELDLKSNFAACSECDFLYYQNPAPCTVLLFHKDNQVLLAKRAIEPRKGYWDVPGGFIEVGETAETSALREAKEETNLDVSPVMPIKIEEFTREDRPGKKALNIIYFCTVESEKGLQLSEEHDMYKWVNEKELDEIKPITELAKGSFTEIFRIYGLLLQNNSPKS